MNFYGSFSFLLLGRYALVAFRKVNFNEIPKIIPKIPVGSFYSFIDNNIYQLEPVSQKSRELFGPEKPVVKLQSSCFGNLIF